MERRRDLAAENPAVPACPNHCRDKRGNVRHHQPDRSGSYDLRPFHGYDPERDQSCLGLADRAQDRVENHGRRKVGPVICVPIYSVVARAAPVAPMQIRDFRRMAFPDARHVAPNCRRGVVIAYPRKAQGAWHTLCRLGDRVRPDLWQQDRWNVSNAHGAPPKPQ